MAELGLQLHSSSVRVHRVFVFYLKCVPIYVLNCLKIVDCLIENDGVRVVLALLVDVVLLVDDDLVRLEVHDSVVLLTSLSEQLVTSVSIVVSCVDVLHLVYKIIDIFVSLDLSIDVF